MKHIRKRKRSMKESNLESRIAVVFIKLETIHEQRIRIKL